MNENLLGGFKDVGMCGGFLLASGNGAFKPGIDHADAPVENKSLDNAENQLNGHPQI